MVAVVVVVVATVVVVVGCRVSTGWGKKKIGAKYGRRNDERKENGARARKECEEEKENGMGAREGVAAAAVKGYNVVA